jgi:hypothetical protein
MTLWRGVLVADVPGKTRHRDMKSRNWLKEK